MVLRPGPRSASRPTAIGWPCARGCERRRVRVRWRSHGAQCACFEDAWAPAVVEALAGLTTFDRTMYLNAVNATRASWEAAYRLRPATRRDWAMAELAAHVADDERKLLLAYELVPVRGILTR